VILESFIVANGVANTVAILSKMVHTKVENDKEMTDKILSDGIYHVTTLENANKIMGSGHIRPSGNLASYGRKKCFFFAGTPNYENICINCKTSALNYEFTAIKVMPNKEEIASFKQRSLNDGAITYLGKCDLPKDRANIVQMVLDLDKDNKVISREKTEEEIEKGEYIPSKILSDKLKINKNQNFEAIKRLGSSQIKVLGYSIKKIASLASNMFKKLSTDKTLLLDAPKVSEPAKKDEVISKNKFTESLKEQTISEESIIKTNNNEEVVQQKKENEFLI